MVDGLCLLLPHLGNVVSQSHPSCVDLPPLIDLKVIIRCRAMNVIGAIAVVGLDGLHHLPCRRDRSLGNVIEDMASGSWRQRV